MEIRFVAFFAIRMWVVGKRKISPLPNTEDCFHYALSYKGWTLETCPSLAMHQDHLRQWIGWSLAVLNLVISWRQVLMKQASEQLQLNKHRHQVRRKAQIFVTSMVIRPTMKSPSAS